MEQLSSHWTIFMKFDIWLFKKHVEKIQVSLKSDKFKGTLLEEPCA